MSRWWVMFRTRWARRILPDWACFAGIRYLSPNEIEKIADEWETEDR